MEFSEKVKKLRNKMILSQTEFAEVMEVTFATVNRWENGRSKPTYKVMRRFVELCKQNGVDLED